MGKKHKNTNLLFFLSAIMEAVLADLEGEFKFAAKVKFNRLFKTVEALNSEIRGKLRDEALDAYSDTVELVAEILNLSIDAFENLQLAKFLEHCEKFKITENESN